MKNSKKIKNVVIGLIIAILVLIGYAAVNGDTAGLAGESTSSLTTLVSSGNFGQVKESDTDLANAEILKILGSIQTISLNDDIFENPVFRQLEDDEFPIRKPAQIGRPNPFLPIGFDALAGVSTSSSSQQNSSAARSGNTQAVSDFFGR